MLIEINTDTLIKFRITAHQYLIGQLIQEKRFEYLTEYLELSKSYDNLPLDMKTLDTAGLLIVPGSPYDFNIIVVRPELSSLLTKGDYFEELIALYPAKVFRADNTYDLLRTDLGRCRQIYDRITLGKKVRHDHIMKCLRYELEMKNATNSMQYMKRLPKWLSSEGWKSYEQRMEDNSFAVNSLEEHEGYGQDIE